MALNLDIDLLRSFLAVADTGSFTRAAARVHRTQSAVSMQIRRLEDAVASKLFERDSRTVSLTADGDALLGYARRIVELHEEAVAHLTRPDVVGVVRLGSPDDYVSRFLPETFSRFAEAYPRVQVEMLCESTDSLTRRLERGELDLALTTCAPGRERGEVIRREPVLWVSSERHAAHEREPLPLALFQEGCIVRDWVLNSLTETGRDWRIAYSSPSIASIHAALEAGQAVSALVRSTIPAGMRVLGSADGFPNLPVVAITLQRAGGVHSEALDCLAAHIAASFAAPELEAA